MIVDFEEYFSFSRTGKLLYKGTDIGISYEQIQDLKFGGADVESMIISLIIDKISTIRDATIDEILS